ncbi:MAG: hypothetical protein A2V70_09230 [Planctomycetes bacterium RBG_13_63_9]|nr:MAG: hypothetical protein A2V70_09230 [Planctomycetes bacterium RBG_13_63_9]
MRKHGWHLEGKKTNTRVWVQVVKLPPLERDDKTDEILHKGDAVIRSLKTPDQHDAGFRILDADGVWVLRNRTAALDMLANLQAPDPTAVIAMLQFRNWTLSNIPFQPEFPGGRVWNIGAQLAYQPTTEERPMEHPHWDMILSHLGKGLDEVVKADPWCQMNGITSGASDLLHWCASLFQRPDQKLPYLFIYGRQNYGKSSLHQGLDLLMSKGYVKAHNALLSKYNGELDGAILAVVEEVDLSGKAIDAYNRMKDLVTGDKIVIHPKYVNPYTTWSYLHWIQCANEPPSPNRRMTGGKVTSETSWIAPFDSCC